MSDKKYYYRQHSKRSRDKMATFLLNCSQKLFMTTILTLLGGSTIVLRDLAQGKKYFAENNIIILLLLLGLAIALFYTAFAGTIRLRNYALQIWDELDEEEQPNNKAIDAHD